MSSTKEPGKSDGEAASRWLAFVREDLRMAELGFEESLWNQVCFHSHQATEKSLKALFAYRGDLPPRTRRLTNLSKSLEDRYPSLGESSDDLLVLENYYIPSRAIRTQPPALCQKACPDAKTPREHWRRRGESRSLSERRFEPPGKPATDVPKERTQT